MPASMPLAVFSVPVMRGVLRLPNFEDPPGVSRQKLRTFASRLCPAPLYSYFHVYALNTCAYVPSVVWLYTPITACPSVTVHGCIASTFVQTLLSAFLARCIFSVTF